VKSSIRRLGAIGVRVASYYTYRRFLLVVAAAGLAVVGLYTDEWWSGLLVLAAGASLLVLIALLGTQLVEVEARIGSMIAAGPEELQTSGLIRGSAVEPQARCSESDTDTASRIRDNSRAISELAGVDDYDSELPLVTVVVPNYNDGRFLGACLRSLRRQTMSDFRCIVVDDCSTDDSVSVASRFVRRDDRFTLVRHSLNSGLSASRNTGLRLARTPFVCFLDSDDFLTRRNLEERVELLVEYRDDPSLAGVYSGIVQMPEDVRLGDVQPTQSWNGPKFQDLLTTRGECPFNCHAPLLHTELLQHLGGFDESMRHGAEDWDLWLRLMRHGFWFRSTGTILGVYRMKAKSMVRSMPREHLREARRLLDSVHEETTVHPTRAGDPAPLDQPLVTYEREVQFARRAIQFAALAAIEQDDAQLDSSLQEMDLANLALIRRHVPVDRVLDQGIRRGIGIADDSYDKLRRLSAPLKSRVKSHLEALADERGSVSPTTDERALGPAVLLVPSNAAQLRRMLAATSDLELGSVTVLRADRQSGDAGLDIVLAARGDVPEMSLNQLAMRSGTPGAVVVQWPYGPEIRGVLERATAIGVQTIELRNDDAPIDRLLQVELSAAGDVTLAPGLDSLVQRAAPGNSPFGLVGELDRESLAQVEESPHLPADISDLKTYEGRHRGERCVIVGNGPSLNELDLSLLRSETTFAVNGIFYAESMNFPPTYYVVEDSSVMTENLDEIRAFAAGHKFFPTIYREIYGEDNGNVSYFTMNRGFYAPESPNYCVPRFSSDASQRVYCGQSVTMINLQLAYYMGFSEVYLIGMDFSYTIPDDAERDGDLITSMSDDPNHFHADYFGKGKTWKDPKLERVLNNYQLAKDMFESDGRKIFNATAGGALELFPRVDYSNVFVES